MRRWMLLACLLGGLSGCGQEKANTVQEADPAKPDASTEQPAPPEKPRPPRQINPAQVGLGLGDRDIIYNLGIFFPEMRSLPADREHLARRRGVSNYQAKSELELWGHPEALEHIILSIPMDGVNGEQMSGNFAIYRAITDVVFPDWPLAERMEWLADNIVALMERQAPDSALRRVSTIRGEVIMRLQVYKQDRLIRVVIERKPPRH